MHLTKEQENMLDGEQGEVTERMFRLLVRLGDIYGAEKMLPVASVQVSGVSYKSLGDPGISFLEDQAKRGGRVRVLTYLNPAGMDIQDWEEMGIPEDFAKKQAQAIEAFRGLGIVIAATCTPYLAGNLPRYRQHIAWSESSAVSFANSVIGARTNREGGPSALAAAICGFTPDYGLHRDENRQPDIVIDVTARLENNADYGALGHHVGKVVENRIPYFTGIEEAGTEQLKALGAAMAASGAVALYHAENATPESPLVKTGGLEEVTVGRKEIDETYAALNQGETPDIVILGCPHASLEEISRLAEKLDGRKLKRPIWICTSRVMKDAANLMGYTATIEEAGGRVVADTCCVVAPIEEMGYATTGVNSGKAAAYLPGFCKQQVVFADIDELVGRQMK